MALSRTYHYDTYREELGKAYPGFGHALWEPNPGDYPPVEVGDVGFIHAGTFHRLFNALQDGDHPSNQSRGVPEHHEQLQPSLENHIFGGDQAPTNFHSHGVTVVSGGLEVLAAGSANAASVSFSCTKKRGAVLALPVAARRQDTIIRDHFREWIITHIDTWFAFTQRLKLGIEMEDIILVTGFHRTGSWSNVTFNEVRSKAKFSLGVEVPGTVGASVNWQASDLRIQGAVHNQGPSGGGLPENQCIFIRGYRVTRRLRILPRRIEAAAEPKPDLRGDDRESEMEVVPISNVTEYRDPLHVLLEYIAKLAPHCDMALVHDDDLEQILGVGDSTSLETLQPDEMVGYLEKLEPEIASMSYALPANDRTPGIEADHTTVAILSTELKSSVSLLSHLSVSTTDRKGSVRDDAPGYPPKLAPSPYVERNIGIAPSPYVDGNIAQMIGPNAAEIYFARLLQNPHPIRVIPPIPQWPFAFFVQNSPVSRPHHLNVINWQGRSAWLLDYTIRHGGTVVQQRIWAPPNEAQRNDHAQLNMPIFFVQNDRQQLGLPIVIAAQRDCMTLLGAGTAAPIGDSSATFIRINWPGYAEWNSQIMTRDQTLAHNTITVEKLAKRVASAVCRFLEEASHVQGRDNRWRIGPGNITRDEVIVIGIIHVSHGSWQPILQLRRYLL